ncbi:DUF6193 family natural product biosynthesis protein [Dokdonia ponticola]|uniref:DUF6193 family natural product biosynthesis protein n=1 Tax=Dokdonia ponticola TaxID=2041041 RepID=A0ABV9HZ00_9FLAO
MYLEIEKYGNINNALNSEFAKIKSPLRVQESESIDKFPLTYALVEYRNKFSQIYLAGKKHVFLPDFWRDGVCLANGQTNELNELVRVVDFWLLNDVSTNELSETFIWVKPNKKAIAFDENRAVEYAWNSYLKNEIFKDFQEFIEIAKQDEIIGKLFPFTSLMRLCFSRCTGYPYTYDIPIVIPIIDEKGKYEVRSSNDVIIGRGTAIQTLKMLKSHLPKNIKPAVKGTADDL